MPNGGVDNCGTCWFNARNGGRVGHLREDELAPVPPFCQIRGLPIDNPFHTYCANHPCATGMERRVTVPVGPVVAALGSSYERRVWRPSPDTEEVRAGLLGFLAAMDETPPTLPEGGKFDCAVIWQLGEFREPRALRGLERVCAFDPDRRGEPYRSRNQRWAIRLAHEALSKILPGPALLPEWAAHHDRAARRIAQGVADAGRYADLPVLADALEEAGCDHALMLAHLREPGEHPPFCWVVALVLGRAELTQAVPDGYGPGSAAPPR